MRFRTPCMYKRKENIKFDHSIIRSPPFARQITIYTLQFTRFNLRPWHLPRSSLSCIGCKAPVRPRQQGLQCGGCFRWNNRACNAGISLEVYHATVDEGAEIEWRCLFCQHPDADSTMEDVSLPDPSPAETSSKGFHRGTRPALKTAS